MNDGSTDNTVDVVRQYPGVRCISQVNAGPAAARNRGAAEARGSLILLTDDDCVPLPGWIDAMAVSYTHLDVYKRQGGR